MTTQISHPAQAQLHLFEQAPIRFIDRDGEPWFTAEEIGKQLGYANLGDDVNRLYLKHEEELDAFSTTAKLAAVDGKAREMRVFNEEGVYLLTMLARTPKAREFRSRLAKMLREMRAQRLEQAKREGRKEGIRALLTLTPAQSSIAHQAMRYWSMGLTTMEIGKLLDVSADQIRRTLKKLGTQF